MLYNVAPDGAAVDAFGVYQPYLKYGALMGAACRL